tara:strand:- start:243 stop:1379 length:1137 start_codon:yes stop_codon:yes gene_type:complete
MTLARGDQDLISTAEGGRPDRALGNVIRDLKNQYSNLSYESKKKIIPSQREKQLSLLNDLEEARALNKSIFTDSPLENDIFNGRNIANAFGALRMAMGDPELAGNIGQAYGVNVSKLSSLDKDTLAMKIILIEGTDPVDRFDYTVGGARNIEKGRAGIIAMYGPGNREWELGRESNLKDQSNWINSLDNIKVYLRAGAIKEIDSGGKLVLQEEIDRILDNLIDPKKRDIAKDIFSSELQGFKDRGFGELGEQVMGGLYGDPRIKGLMSDVYPTLVDAQDAYRDDTFSLIPTPPPVIPTSVPLGEREDIPGYETFSISPEIQTMLDTFSFAERTGVGAGLAHSTSQADSDRYAARIEAQYRRNQEKEPIPTPSLFDPEI